MTERKPAIDIFKFIAAILVITIHTEPLLSISETANFIQVHYIARVAVPFFIVCTGFFIGKRITWSYDGKVDNIKATRIAILKSSWKVFRLYLICSVIYLFLSIPQWIETGWFSIEAFIDWGIAFFLKGSYYHLWYLMEVCYALIILALILPIVRKPYIFIFTLVLWFVEAVAYGYSFLLPSGIQQLYTIANKAQMPFESVVRVLPLLLVGIVIQKERQRKPVAYLLGLLLSFALLGGEIYLVKFLGGEKFSYLLCTLPVAYFLFQTVHSMDELIHIKNSIVLSDISTFVYCAHPAIILIISTYLRIEIPNMWMFILVTVASFVGGYAFYYLKKRFFNIKKS